MKLKDYVTNIFIPLQETRVDKRTVTNFKHTYDCYCSSSFLHDMELEDIDTKAINRWTTEELLIKNKHLKSTTQRKYFCIIRTIFSCAFKEGYIDYNPFTNAIKPNLKAIDIKDKDDTFTRQEVDKIMDNLDCYCSKHLHMFILLLFYTGARLNEIRQLKREDFIEDNTMIVIRGTKTLTSVRRVPIPKDIADKVLYELSEPFSSFLFYNQDTQDLYTCDALRKSYYTYLKKLGIRKRRVHDIRHTTATLLVTSNKIDIATIAKLLGHKNPLMTLQRYTHISDTQLKEINNVTQELFIHSSN